MKTIESILVATDLTESSDEILRAGAALAALAGAKLHVVHAFDLDVTAYARQGGAPPTFPDRVQAAQGELDGQIRRVVGPGVDVASREVVIYVAHRAVLERAEAVGADLIVLGPHRKRPRGDAFLGSTADRVIRTAPVPCLVVRGPLSLPLRRVLVPLDLSEPARGALDAGLAWSEALRTHGGDAGPGTRVTVVHVVPRIFDVPDVRFDRSVIAPELHREVEAALGRAGGTSTLEVREEVRWGDAPAVELLRVAEEEKSDLVVIATHGHGAVRRALIGSVASAVARGAPCPVLLVPPRLWNEAEA